MLRKLFKSIKFKFASLFAKQNKFLRLPRREHNISRRLISNSALKVLYRLKNSGFEAYLVGGSVRDLILGNKPKDFDVATDATPEEVLSLFNNCRLVGRRFRLAHIYFGRDMIEVATFRKGHRKLKRSQHQNEQGMIIQDNVYGTLKEDALRRDFTMNALYYNIQDFDVLDYCGGTKDIAEKKIVSIGAPMIRFREDPVRMLRAIRFAAKLNFELDEDIIFAISKLNQLIKNVPPARLFEEIQKILICGKSTHCLDLLITHKLFEVLLPQTFACLSAEDIKKSQHNLLIKLCEKTDARIAKRKRVTIAYVFAGLLWYAVNYEKERIEATRIAEFPAMFQAMESVLQIQNKTIAIPRRFQQNIKDIWTFQIRLVKRQGSKTEKLITHPRFRDGYEFLLLRAKVDPSLSEYANWWSQFIEGTEDERKVMLQSLQVKRKKTKRRKYRKKVKRNDHNKQKI